MKKDELLSVVQCIPKNRKKYIVAAGRYGQIISEWFNANGVFWSGFIDKNKNGKLNGQEIYSYENVNEDDYYVISTYTYKDEIKRQLIDAGASQNHIITIDNQAVIYDILEENNGTIYNSKSIGEFSNKYRDERCFLVGNGPSLRMEDLEIIKNEKTFACNSIYGVYKYTQWRPTFYFYGDPSFVSFLKDNKDVYDLLHQDSVVFSPLITGAEHTTFNSANHYYYKTLNATNRECPDFSSDCSVCVYTQGTIMYQMLQAAMYFGFSEIYLLGIDFSFSNELHSDGSISRKKVKNHMDFIEEEERLQEKYIVDNCGETYLADIEWQKAGYIAAREFSKKKNVKIYNATRGGKLEVFRRVDFDDLF